METTRAREIKKVCELLQDRTLTNWSRAVLEKYLISLIPLEREEILKLIKREVEQHDNPKRTGKQLYT